MFKIKVEPNMNYTFIVPPEQQPTPEIASNDTTKPTKSNDINPSLSAISTTKDNNLNSIMSKYSDILCKPLTIKLTKLSNFDCELEKNKSYEDEIAENSSNDENISPIRRYPQRIRTNRQLFPQNIYSNSNEKKLSSTPKSKTCDFSEMDDTYCDYTNCEVAHRYDTEKNFFPRPGPSTVNYYDGIDIPGYYEPLKKTPARRGRPPKPKSLYTSYPADDYNSDDDPLIQSFYVEAFMNTPSMHEPNTDTPQETTESPKQVEKDERDDIISTPEFSKILLAMQESQPSVNASSQTNRANITPKIRPPRLIEIKRAFDRCEMPKVVNPVPHYGDPLDLSATSSTKMEVGNSLLQLAGNSLNDLDEFTSQLGLVGLNGWRQRSVTNMILLASGGDDMDIPENTNYVRKFLADEKLTNICPAEEPPNYWEANAWLNQECNETYGNEMNYEEDSPIKVEPGKITTIIIDSDDDDHSARSISQSPEPLLNSQSENKVLDNGTNETMNKGISKFYHRNASHSNTSSTEIPGSKSESNNDQTDIDAEKKISSTNDLEKNTNNNNNSSNSVRPLNSVKDALVSTNGW